jgi:hypothetical protein
LVGAYENRREGLSATEFDDVVWARPSPIVLEQRVGDQPRPDDEQRSEENPLRQALAEERLAKDSAEENAGHARDADGPEEKVEDGADCLSGHFILEEEATFGAVEEPAHE